MTVAVSSQVWAGFSSRGDMTTSMYSSSAPASFSSEPESFGDDEHNVWNLLLAHFALTLFLMASEKVEWVAIIVRVATI